MKNRKFETIAIRNQLKRTEQKEHSVPLFLTSSFVFDSAENGAEIFQGTAQGNLYSRFSNPNTDEFIEKLALLEGTETGVATASGMAAVYTSLMAHLKQGDHLVASRAIFGNTTYIITQLLPKMGVTYTLVDIDDAKAWTEAIQKNTKLIFIESPSNPTLKLADLSFLGQLCQQHGILFLVDNCFATPYLQQPISFGADLVIHSATKFIDGQGRVLGGAILGRQEVIAPCYEFIRRTGASLSPFNAWVLSKSLETLAIRMDRHCENALKIATFLEQHPEVNKVIYPDLKSYPQYDLAKKQMKKGGGLVAFETMGGVERGRSILNSLNIFSLTANLGDCRSIATHPASTTHSKLNPEELKAADITSGFIRLSIGLEHADDLIEDLAQALSKSVC